jgi:hypothetical protein
MPHIPSAPVTIEQFLELVKLFPMGRRIQYYPSEQADIRLETLLLGYRVNGIDIYSPSDFRLMNHDQGGQRLQLANNPQRRSFGQIETLSLLIPCETEGMERLDYLRRAELEQLGHTDPGRELSVVGATVGRRTPFVCTRLMSIEHLHDGVFANQRVFLLDVDIATLNFFDQRQYFRIPTQLPAELQPATGGEIMNCDIRDFSEISAQVELVTDAEVPDNLWEGRRVILGMLLEDRPLRLQGRVIRRALNRLVLRFEAVQRNEEFIPLSMLEALGIKSSILQQAEKYPVAVS